MNYNCSSTYKILLFIMKHKIQIELTSLEKNIIKSYIAFLTTHLNLKKIDVSLISMPVKTKVLTLQRSPHVYKKAREQFQFSTYKTVMTLSSNNYMLLKHLLLAKPTSVNLVLKYK